MVSRGRLPIYTCVQIAPWQVEAQLAAQPHAAVRLAAAAGCVTGARLQHIPLLHSSWRAGCLPLVHTAQPCLPAPLNMGCLSFQLPQATCHWCTPPPWPAACTLHCLISFPAALTTRISAGYLPMVYTATLAYYLDNAFEEAGLILPVSWGSSMLCWAALVWRRGGWALSLAIARPAAACC